MRILHLTSHMNVGGIPQYILSLCRQQVDRNHRVIIASGGGLLVAHAETLGVTHWALPLRTSAEFSLQVFRGVRGLATRLGSEPVDVIHAHTRVGQVVADRICRKLGIPYVTTWHGIYKARLGRRLWPCTGVLTIAISGPVRQHLLQDLRVPEERIRCIYNGIDTVYYATPPDPAVIEAFRRRWGIRSDQPVVGSVGRLAAGRVKGFDTLLVAAYLLRQLVPDIQILIVGDGPRRPFLEDIVARLRIQNYVRFVGETQDVKVALAVMDLFIFPSRWPEAFGLTLVEAMAAGKPVIGTRVGAVPEIVRNNLDGWLVPPDDPAALAEGIVHLLNNPATAQRFGRQAQARVVEAFSSDRMAAEVEAVYQEAIRDWLRRPSGVK